ncbi:MAG TPA: DUF4350 domain-containing protein [Pyrinomonadaceae bacterium]|nr:DUF4350 domain-containing protein [Pyrinomonadaceae bacterium]
MRKRFGIIATIVLAIVVLVAINSLSYVSDDEKQDSEFAPNRSTYHAGPTGTRAFYDLLSESGHRVMRWRESPEKLLASSGDQVGTFVIIGDTRVPIEDEEAQSLLHWVKSGGRLVLVDRHPQNVLLPPSGDWVVTTEFLIYPDLTSEPGNQQKMTEGTSPINPSQPTLLTRSVHSVLTSRYYAAIRVTPLPATAKTENSPSQGGGVGPIVVRPEDAEESEPDTADIPSGMPPASAAPVVHLSNGKSAVLLDYPHGLGRIIVMSDPYLVANGGINLNDNLQLALNLVSTPDGMIAFDEFHQGHGITRNAFASYFAGTPVLAICGQIALLILVVLWTRGRRFGRPLPLPRVDRRSSLEFVASMAELQQRARAYDLAIENVYSRTRRVLARYAGMDYNSPRSEIARRVASRSTIEAHQLETLMRQAEEAINGGAISERQSVHLVRRLREVERSLGLRLRSRELKQTAQNI